MRDYGAERDVYDGLAALVKRVGIGLWPFTPFTELVKEAKSDMAKSVDHLPDPNYCDPPDPGPVLVCDSCGSDDVNPDMGWCYSCEAYRDVRDEEEWLKEHPEHVVPQEER